MLETLLSPLTDYFLGTVGDPSANVEAARSAASGEVLWSGVQLAGDGLREMMHKSTRNLVLWGLAVLGGFGVFLRAWSKRKGPEQEVDGLLLFLSVVLAVCGIGFGGLCLGLHEDLVAQAESGIAIEPTRVVLVRNGVRKDYPASALTVVTRDAPGGKVTLRFGEASTLRIDTGSSDFASLSKAVERLAETAGGKAPLRRGDLG